MTYQTLESYELILFRLFYAWEWVNFAECYVHIESLIDMNFIKEELNLLYPNKVQLLKASLARNLQETVDRLCSHNLSLKFR